MKKLRKYLRLYRLFFAQYLKTMMQSKVDFFMGFLAFFAEQALGILFISVIFSQIPALAGWGFHEILFVYGFAQIPRGLDHMFTDLIWGLANDMVIEGSFDRYILRPINPLFHICADKFQPDGLGELVVGGVIVIIAASQLTLAITPLWVLMFIISILLGTVIYTSIKLAFAALAFWVKDSGPILQVAYNSADFAKYPMDIYNAGIRFILTFIIPFAVVAYYPASYFLGKGELLPTIGLEAVVAVAAWVIAYGVFKLGMNRYESAGN